jgi:hypothetical protein
MKVTPKPEIKRRWDTWRLQRVQKGRRKHENRIRGLGLVIRLDDGRKVAFRGRQYEVPPVPWPLALEVLEAEQDLAALQASKTPRMSEWRAFQEKVCRLSRRAMRPDGWRRWLWPILPNPFRSATSSEVGELLRFFSMCLIMDEGESHLENLARRGTSLPTSGVSSHASRNGAGMVNRVVGSIS